jgi:ABC-2 type transport system permease protein
MRRGISLLRRYATLYGAFFHQHLKVLLEYRMNFVIAMLSSLVWQGTYVASILLIMDRVPTIGGWTVDEILLLYGIFGLGTGLERTFTDNLLFFGAGQVRYGALDRLLVRPVNPLFHLVANRFSYEGAGDIIAALIILGRTLPRLHIPLSPGNIAYILLIAVCGWIICFSLFLLATTLTFWITVATPVALTIGHLFQFQNYPLSIYSRGIQRLLTWVLPFGLVSYYPAQYLLHRGAVGPMAFVAVPMAMLLFCIAGRFWVFGLRRYVGAGS